MRILGWLPVHSLATAKKFKEHFSFEMLKDNKKLVACIAVDLDYVDHLLPQR